MYATLVQSLDDYIRSDPIRFLSTYLESGIIALPLCGCGWRSGASAHGEIFPPICVACPSILQLARRHAATRHVKAL
eukprot:scaffold39273_cov53-Attheya_sp.AAC.2